ncbi:transposase [Orientia tsutsugamushi]|uniref:transposase n=1 Tax=Orientia tsutsugamushi TaxID=784 RepID=UPI000A5DC889|nr:hypothetical protein F0363_01475 [Orientia tsutsugamushi]
MIATHFFIKFVLDFYKSLLLNKGHIIETINGQLKHLFYIDYTHHRSVICYEFSHYSHLQ